MMQLTGRRSAREAMKVDPKVSIRLQVEKENGPQENLRPESNLKRSQKVESGLVAGRPSGATLRTGACFANANTASTHIAAIEVIDSVGCGVIVSEGDESETLATTRVTVLNHDCIGDFSTRLEVSTKLSFIRCPGETPDKYTITHCAP